MPVQYGMNTLLLTKKGTGTITPLLGQYWSEIASPPPQSDFVGPPVPQ